MIGELVVRHLVIETNPSKVRPIEPNHLQADVPRPRRLIEWTPHFDLRRGLADLLHYEWFYLTFRPWNAFRDERC